MLSRLRRLRAARPDETGVGDGLTGPTPNMVRRPFAEPLSVVDLEALPAEVLDDGRLRVTFWANVRDASGGRCPDVVVDARIDGPERSGTGSAWTDEYGAVRFRMTGPPGRYRCEVVDVGAGAFAVRRDDDGLITAVETEAGS